MGTSLLQSFKEDGKEGDSSAKRPSQASVRSQGCQATEAILAANAFFRQVTPIRIQDYLISSSVKAQTRAHSADSIRPVKKELAIEDGWCVPSLSEPGASSANAGFHSAKDSLSEKRSDAEEQLTLHTESFSGKTGLLCSESSPMEDCAHPIKEEGANAEMPFSDPFWGGLRRDADRAKEWEGEAGTKQGLGLSKISRAWSEKEDSILLLHVAAHGEAHWKKASVRLLHTPSQQLDSLNQTTQRVGIGCHVFPDWP